MRMLTISQFLQERKLNLPPTKYERIYKLALRATREGLSERVKNKSNHFTYDERVLEAAYRCIENLDETIVFLDAIKKLDKPEGEAPRPEPKPDQPKAAPGFVTIKDFCEKHNVTDRGEISRLASSLFAAGLLERQKLRGKNLMAYREKDLAEIARNSAARRAAGEVKRFNRGKKNDSAQAEPTPASPDISPVLSGRFDSPARIVHRPGIFVRFWRWLFGYREEMGV